MEVAETQQDDTPPLPDHQQPPPCDSYYLDGSEMLILAPLSAPQPLPDVNTDCFPWLAVCLRARGAVSGRGPGFTNVIQTGHRCSAFLLWPLLSLGSLDFFNPS